MPVNVRPNISSSGGTSLFGVTVLVTVSFEASSAGKESSAWAAFCLRRAVVANVLKIKGSDRASFEEAAELRSSLGRSIVVGLEHQWHGNERPRTEQGKEMQRLFLNNALLNFRGNQIVKMFGRHRNLGAYPNWDRIATQDTKPSGDHILQTNK